MGHSCFKWVIDRLQPGILPRDVAKNLGVSVPTLYRWVPAYTANIQNHLPRVEIGSARGFAVAAIAKDVEPILFVQAVL